MDHTPSTSAADERALRLLEHAALPEARKALLIALVRGAQSLADDAGEDLQAEFGREHIGLIAGHNQFLRIMRAGADPGAVEISLDDAAKKALAAAGFALREPDGLVFRMFGWVRVDPEQGPQGALEAAIAAAFAKARAPARGAGPRLDKP